MDYTCFSQKSRRFVLFRWKIHSGILLNLACACTCLQAFNPQRFWTLRKFADKQFNWSINIVRVTHSLQKAEHSGHRMLSCLRKEKKFLSLPPFFFSPFNILNSSVVFIKPAVFPGYWWFYKKIRLHVLFNARCDLSFTPSLY